MLFEISSYVVHSTRHSLDGSILHLRIRSCTSEKGAFKSVRSWLYNDDSAIMFMKVQAASSCAWCLGVAASVTSIDAGVHVWIMTCLWSTL